MVMLDNLDLQVNLTSMERHVPVHPLPEEIQQMRQDETVCRYCGVSYLIHREFKLMEEKLKAMEAEMEFYRESVEREEKLQRELCSMKQHMEQLKSDHQQKKESLNFLSLELATKQEELEGMCLKMEDNWRQLVAVQNKSKLYRERTKQQAHIIDQASTFLQGIKIELALFREDVQSNLVIWEPFSKTLMHYLQATGDGVQMEMFGLRESLKKSTQEVEFLQQQVKDLQLSSDTITLQIDQIHVLEQKEAELEIKCCESEKQALDLKNQLMIQQLNFQKIAEEMEHCKELLLNKSKEVEDLLSRLTVLECAHDERESRYCKEIKEKEKQWLQCEQKCKSLEEQLEIKVCQESEIQNRSSVSQNEILTLKTALSQAEEKLEALKQEREQMVISHQNRIKQLQERLQQMLGDEDNWRAKIDAALSKQQAHHRTELKELALQMKEEAKIEIDTERQKQQELINKHNKEHETLQTQVSDLISDVTKALQLELSKLKKKLQETQCQLLESARSKDGKIYNLEKVILQLETQLKQEQSKVESVTEELRTEKQQKSIELRETHQELQRLTGELDQAKEENTFLEETVRRECEERYELTEALSQAREQLMELKSLSREHPHSQRSISQRSLSSSSSSAGSYKIQRSLSSTSRTKLSGLHGLLVNANASNNAGTTALPIIPVPQPSKGRASSVSEIKQRIAAAVRRK
ncbi:protein LEKR1 isoform X1 [Stegostoma tigrinum]|uniref:protein LEKR1 isoform X1 n=1 Tax=Stegostoma tigrinum TaxID=3053191 RepID=UPI00202AD515|nr:protein LEKR1 isoform X1 [Stegostoma tigrinum]